jgi:transcriptional regulator with XRE-family HTH domain
MSDDRIELATRLREAREYLGLNQEEVAKTIGVSRSALSLMESGQRKVDALELKRLAEIYQRPVGYFTGEIPPPAEVPENVAHLARTAAKLTEKDREELLNFARFLRSKGRG